MTGDGRFEICKTGSSRSKYFKKYSAKLIGT